MSLPTTCLPLDRDRRAAGGRLRPRLGHHPHRRVEPGVPLVRVDRRAGPGGLEVQGPQPQRARALDHHRRGARRRIDRRTFSFATLFKDGHSTRWTYEMTASGDGTTLTESFESIDAPAFIKLAERLPHPQPPGAAREGHRRDPRPDQGHRRAGDLSRPTLSRWRPSRRGRPPWPSRRTAGRARTATSSQRHVGLAVLRGSELRSVEELVARVGVVHPPHALDLEGGGDRLARLAG